MVERLFAGSSASDTGPSFGPPGATPGGTGSAGGGLTT
jgi:hypothetical protein